MIKSNKFKPALVAFEGKLFWIDLENSIVDVVERDGSRRKGVQNVDASLWELLQYAPTLSYSIPPLNTIQELYGKYNINGWPRG